MSGETHRAKVAMRTMIGGFTLTYPGIQHVEHEYFYAVISRAFAEPALLWVIG